MNKKEILKTVYNYYPKNIPSHDILYKKSIEYQRLKVILEAPPHKEAATNLFDELVVKYGDKCVKDMTLFGWGNPCYHFRVSILDKEKKWNTYVIFISVISEYYYIYLNDDLWRIKNLKNNEDFREINKIVGKNFSNHKELKPLVAKSIIPDIDYGHKYFGEVTILHCLFTDHIY